MLREAIRKRALARVFLLDWLAPSVNSQYNFGVNPLKVFCAPFAAGLCQFGAAVYGQASQTTSEVVAADHARPHELAGFFLRQDRKAFEAALGKPFHEQEGEHDTRVLAYHLPGSKSDYLAVFIYYPKSKEVEQYGKAVQMELTGDEPSGPTGFFGLQLGDPAEKVEKALGKPTVIRHEDDVNLDLWDYPKSNYSVEISSDRKLYSIQIVDQEGDDTPHPAGSNEARIFAEALLARDWDRVAEMTSGEIECYMSQNYYGIQSGAGRRVLSDPKAGISVCLHRASEAVVALGPDMKGTDDAMRWWEKHTIGSVTKLPDSSPLKEIVFDQEAGAMRVYEVTFR